VQLRRYLCVILETVREQRSPQFGLLDTYGDYSDYDDNSRQFRLGSKRRVHHKPYHHHHGLTGGHGCRGYDCGGYAYEKCICV